MKHSVKQSSLRLQRISIVLISSLILSLFFLPIHSQWTQAEPSVDEIRVALFVDAGIAYRNTVPIVSLSSDTGLALRGSNTAYESHPAPAYARFTLDQFFMIATESSNAATARQASQRLSQEGFDNVILRLTKNNEAIYRVVTGSEAQLSTLQAQQEQVKNATQLEPTLAGSFRLSTPSYADREEAVAVLSQLQALDVSTYVVQVLSGGQRMYQIWLGDSVDQATQSQLLVELQPLIPSIPLQPAQASEYVMLSHAVLFGQGTEEIPFYWVSPHQPVTITPIQAGIQPLITVEERFNRSYRGSIELSRYQHKLTVVNILPLEEYLYSVVGTEMATGWPMEALKTQAIMSRNYAYMNIRSNKYGVAHLSDTVFEQAYYGYSREANDVRQAVNQTRGEFLTYNGQVFSTFYYSNAGGMTADGREVWGNSLVHHTSVSSNDIYPETVQIDWYRVQDRTGKIGYVSSQYIDRQSQQTALGYSYGTVNTSSLNYRSGPSTNHSLIGSLQLGDRVIIIDTVKQNNAYSWISGPFYGQELMTAINGRSVQTQPISQPVRTLEVVQRGASGRVMQLEANGQRVATTSPDGYRSVFVEGGSSLRSTKFDIESMGEYHVLAGGGQQLSFPVSSQPSTLHALSSGGQKLEVNPNHNQFVMLNKAKELRVVSKEPSFRLHGNGFGHGLGASQWGIRAMASEGKTYVQILKHYFHPQVAIEKKY